jgi:small subunit ribosomal protein S1
MDALLEKEAQAMLAGLGKEVESGNMETLVGDRVTDMSSGTIREGVIVGFAGDDVVIELGLKSEGMIPRDEFDGADIKLGDKVKILVEKLDGTDGQIEVSKRKADRMLNWQRLIDTTREGDVIEGKVTKKIKGGLLVDIGVPVFLPASQVDVRRPADIGEFINRTIRASVLKIDQERRNIVISRRKLIEEEREMAKKRLLETLKEGQMATGEVKNIADFGAFIDLGGIDGLLHITDMSWGRINHPSELLKLGQKIEVKVLNIDRDKEKIALGLKQKEVSPWEEIEQKYPVGSRVHGSVVNLMSYGAFVRLEDGIEGLVHISEMSWTRRVNHPSELVNVNDPVDVVILEINKEKQEISLGMKQIEVNPWELVSEKYPPGTVIEGAVRNLANYGAFVEIEPGIDGLIHISDMSWTKRVQHPSEVVKKGDAVDVVILNIDSENKRISLGLKQAEEDPWLRIGETYPVGTELPGKIVRLMDKGVVVDLGNDIEGFVPVSQLNPEGTVTNPADFAWETMNLVMRVLEVDPIHRRIVLAVTSVPEEQPPKPAEPSKVHSSEDELGL